MPELTFEQWKAKYAPHDSGRDYDLRGAYEAGIVPSENQHFPDTFKLPNHPTFSIESKYWKPGMPAGRWEGEKYIPMDAPTAQEWVKQHPQRQGMADEKDLQSSYDGVTGWLKGLMDVLGTGFRSTADAFQTDVSALRAGQFPPQALKAGQQGFAAMGEPSINPAIPTLDWTTGFRGPEGPGQFLMQTGKGTAPGGDWLQMYLRSGRANPVLEEMFNMWEKSRDWITPPAPGLPPKSEK